MLTLASHQRISEAPTRDDHQIPDFSPVESTPCLRYQPSPHPHRYMLSSVSSPNPNRALESTAQPPCVPAHPPSERIRNIAKQTQSLQITSNLNRNIGSAGSQFRANNWLVPPDFVKSPRSSSAAAPIDGQWLEGAKQ